MAAVPSGPLSVPCAGPVTMVAARTSPDVEGARQRIERQATLLRQLALRSLMVGASFTGVTVNTTVATFESNSPSLSLKRNESAPLKLAFGV